MITILMTVVILLLVVWSSLSECLLLGCAAMSFYWMLCIVWLKWKSQETDQKFPSGHFLFCNCVDKMMWSICEIIHVWTAVVDESEEWSLQLIFQFKQLERRSPKKSGLQQVLNPWPLRYRWHALPTELWSHTLGVRSIYWIHISRE